MPAKTPKSITFYRQMRRDGGVRSGVYIDDDSILHHFQPSNGHRHHSVDPKLDWWVDVRISGNDLPTRAASIRKWCLQKEHAATIRQQLRQAANELGAGIDWANWPVKIGPSVRKGLSVAVVCSAARRIEARELGCILAQMAESWESMIAKLAVPEETRA